MAGIKSEKYYQIHSFDVDYKYDLKPSKFLSFFQDAAMSESEKLGYGKKYLEENNLTWVITRYNIQINKYPKYRDNIKVQTYMLYCKKLFAFRKFEVFSENNELLAEATAAFMLIDKTNNKALVMNDDIKNMYQYKDENDEKVNFNNINLVDNSTIEKQYEVRYNDIDVNMHVNNAVYFIWTIETLPSEYIFEYRISKIEINFKKEGLLDDKITVKTDIVKKDEKVTSIHNIFNQDGKLLCLIKVERNPS